MDNPPVSDDLLTNNIQEGMVYVSAIDKPENINVEVNHGIVYLSGNVTYFDEKNTAHKIASLHDGYKTF